MAKKELLIEVDAIEVFDRIREQTELIGKKSSTDGDYENKSMDSNERSIFDRYFAIACSEITDTFAHYLSSDDSNVDAASYTLLMPSTYKSSSNYALNNAVATFLYNKVVASWMEVVDKERMPEFNVLAESARVNVRRLLLSKEVHAPEHDEEVD